MKNYFDKEMSTCLKGVGIILLLFHHLFYSHEVQDIVFHIWESEFCFLELCANQAKICVSLFLILSGYGMSQSLKKRSKDEIAVNKKLSFVLMHIIKIYLNFWPIYFLCAFFDILIYLFAGKLNILQSYGGSIGAFLKDFFCISGFYINSNTINSTWWFLSAILLCYILFPIYFWLVERYPLSGLGILLLLLISSELISLRPQSSSFFIIIVWSASFFIGILYSKFDVLNRLYYYCVRSPIQLIIFFIASIIFRYYVGYKGDMIAATLVIILGAVLVNRLPYVQKFLLSIGECSMDIFLFHTFIFVTYFRNEVYALYYPILIYVVFLFVCWGIGRLMMKLKSICKIPNMLEKLSLYLGI